MIGGIIHNADMGPDEPMAIVHVHDQPHNPGASNKIGKAVKLQGTLHHVSHELHDDGSKTTSYRVHVHNIDGLGSKSSAQKADPIVETEAALKNSEEKDA